MASQQDWEDINKAVAGDDQAFGRIIERYEKMVASFLWRFTENQSTLEDLLQDVFLEIHKSLPRFNGDSKLSTWILTIATRMGYRFWKREARYTKQKSAYVEWVSSRQLENMAASEAMDFAKALLAQLKPKDRIVITLFYFDNCSLNEIAKRLGWSVTYVKVRLHRARNTMKQIYEKMEKEHGNHE